MARVLIIDDDPAMVQVMSDICSESGHTPIAYNSGEKALGALASHAPQLVLTDVRMDGVGGMEVLRVCRETMPGTPVIMITANKQLQMGIEAMKAGAYDYIPTPFKVDELRISIGRAIEHQNERVEMKTLRQAVREKYRFENIVGTSKRMQRVFDLIGKVANTDSTILIEGESGTGKELVARALHFNSSRQNQPFVAINCSALPENLLESELFGHRKGAFTGAVADKIGLFEEAEGGTIFLDEVNSMSPLMQTKLLRVLQERTLRRVGDTKSVPIHVRVLAATNEPLYEMTQSGAFREDLYYRLAVIPIELPPLRNRLDDIPLLVQYFLQKQALNQKTEDLIRVDGGALQLLAAYRWPGNVRELENAMERACALCEDGIIHVRDLPPHLAKQEGLLREGGSLLIPVGEKLAKFMQVQETAYIEATIRMNEGVREQAARMLGISMATLYRKLEVSRKAAGSQKTPLRKSPRNKSTLQATSKSPSDKQTQVANGSRRSVSR
jgi:DNA-binding NtrC family response regulator